MLRLINQFIVVACVLATPAYAQVLYLSPYQGDGSEATPFIPHGVGQGAQCAPLPTHAICTWDHVPVASGVVELTNNRAITGLERARIASNSKHAVTAPRANALISELVDTEQLSLRPKNRRQRIVIQGREVWSRAAPLASYLPSWREVLQAPVRLVEWMVMPAVAWAATTVTETFNAADQDLNPFTGDHVWHRDVGQSIEILNNELDVQFTSSTQEANNQTTLDDDDMEVSANIVRVARGSATNYGPALTARTSDSSSSTLVYCQVRDASTPYVEYGHKISGSLTITGTTNHTTSTNDILKTRIVGDQLSCYVNGVLMLGPVTDNTGAGNLVAGVRFVGNGTGNSSTRASIDNWVATNNVTSTNVRPRGAVPIR